MCLVIIEMNLFTRNRPLCLIKTPINDLVLFAFDKHTIVYYMKVTFDNMEIWHFDHILLDFAMPVLWFKSMI